MSILEDRSESPADFRIVGDFGAVEGFSPASDNFVLGRELDGELEHGHQESVALSEEALRISSKQRPDGGITTGASRRAFDDTARFSGAWPPTDSPAWLYEEICLSCGSQYMPDASYCRKCGQKRELIPKEMYLLEMDSKAAKNIQEPPQLVTRRDLEDVERRLEPIEDQMKAIRQEMHRSASEVAAEVRALTERLSTPTLAAHSGPLGTLMCGSRRSLQESLSDSMPRPRIPPQQEQACAQNDEPSPTQQRLQQRRFEVMEQELAARELALLERERAEGERAVHERPQHSAQAPSSGLPAPATHSAPQREAQAADVSDLGLRRQLAEATDELKEGAEERMRLKRQIVQLKETLQQREFELDSRPTHRLVQQLRNEITRLERELHPEREALRRVADTRELMRRDRRGLQQKPSIARQAADALQPSAKIPRQEVERILTSICGALGVADFVQADGAVRKMAEVVEQRLPRLERFATEVFDIVNQARASEMHGDSSEVGAEEALVEIRSWRAARQTSGGVLPAEAASRRLRTSLASELRQRSAGAALETESSGVEPSDEMLLRHVAELVAAERSSSDMEALFKQAESEMISDPQQTLHRILRHFMQLFEVRSLEGCLPTMNTIYTRLSELDTLYGAICDFLHLAGPVKPRVTEVIRSLRRLEKGATRSPAMSTRAACCLNS